MILSEFIGALIQIGVALIIGLIVWLIVGRRKAGFFRWLGLHGTTFKALGFAVLAVAVLSPLSVWLYLYGPLTELASSDGTVASAVAEQGWSAVTIAVILVIAFLKTALAEEILFRGVIARRLFNLIGFWPGNIVQALIFASVHLLLFLAPDAPEFTPLLAGLLVGRIALSALVIGWINEKMGKGSIWPGWLMHGLGNAIFYPLVAFA